MPPFMICDHHIGALQENNRICTTRHIVSLTIIANKGKKQKKEEKVCKNNVYCCRSGDA